MFIRIEIALCVLIILLSGCGPVPGESEPSTAGEDTDAAFSLDFEKYQLDNGLTVILHVDRSDPVTAVALTAHVGSAREKPGRTGFAHLFEHLLFLESENLGKGGLDRMSARIGGSGANGSTSRDRTNYFQTVPNDALEKMIWAEADKLGFFINTVTEPVLAKEKQVVKNEKRLGVDNVPYGHTYRVIDENLYPEGHPYSWQVIGSLQDLQAAELADVKEFFRRWYVPNNVILAIAGDFDPEQAKTWIEKYFGEIPAGPDIPAQEKQPALLDENRRLAHEDNFARLPRLSLTWPGVHRFHPDEHALDVLARLLTIGKEAPLNQVLIEEQQLTAKVSMGAYNSELAGQVNIFITAFEDVGLERVYSAVEEGLRRFEERGISVTDLDRVKAFAEREFYEQFESAMGKAFTLAQYEIYTGDPGHVEADLRHLKAVTTEDVLRVYDRYLRNRPHVATSFVPLGRPDLALEGSADAGIEEEAIVQNAEETFDPSLQADYERTPSRFDRTVEPPYGPGPEIQVPEVTRDRLPNGINVYSIHHDELPLVRFSLVLDGGQLLDDPSLPGTASMTSRLMLKGTQSLTTAELENAIEELGAKISIQATAQQTRLSGSTLSRNFGPTMDLVRQILLEPRWDAQELELARQEVISILQQQSADPGSIASLAYRKLIYGEGSPLAGNILGNPAAIQAISMNDLESFHARQFSPDVARIHVVGDIRADQVVEHLAGLGSGWEARDVELPEVEVPGKPSEAAIFFIDVPGAKQSVLRIGYPALAKTDEDFYPATIANYRLGGGGFASRFTLQVREDKGYTYSIRSGFNGSDLKGPFTISSSVRSNVTLEAISLIRDILEDYRRGFDDEDLRVTQDFLLKSQARSFETMGSKLSMLENISAFGWPDDYVVQRQSVIRGMTTAEIRRLASDYLDAGRMIYLVVGDAETQLQRLNELGFGAPVLITYP